MVISDTLGIVLLVGIFGALSNILKKSVLYILNPIEFLMLTFLFEFLFMFIFFIVSGDMRKHFKKIKSKITWKIMGSVGVFALLITGLSFGSVLLTKRENISKIDPILAIVGTLFTFLGGIFVLGEKAETKDYIALILMMIGIGIMAL
jgi:drug/metabolite transporter (DMT)-like permease